MRRFILRRLPWLIAVLAVYWIALFVGTHVPHLPRVQGGVHLDKVMHFTGYAGLAFLAAAAFLRKSWSRRGAAAVLVGLMAYGVLDELSQIPVSGRSADLLDWFADCLGVMTGMIVFRLGHKAWSFYRETREPAGKMAVDQAA